MKNFAWFFNNILFKYRFCLTVVLVSANALTSTYSQNVSGLEGKSLTKVDDIGAGLVSLIGSKGLEGKISKVTVTADGERTLKFVVEYTGFPTAYLYAEVLTAAKGPQNEVREAELDLTGKTSPISLELNLNENVAEGLKLESAYLQLRIAKGKSTVGGLIFLFALNKSWQKEIRAENLLLQARLEPVGVTSQLKEGTKVAIMPVKKSVMTQQSSNPLFKSTSTSSSTSSTTTFKKTASPPAGQKVTGATGTGRAIERRTPDYQLSQAGVNTELKAGINLDKSDTDKGAKGPDNNPIPLFEDLTVTKDFEFPYEITNISMDVFPDKNPASGMFYYLPTAYYLRWTADEGYAFRVLYGTASSESAGEVRMVATLSPDISKKEIDLISKLLTSYTGRNAMKFDKLRLIPIQEDPAVSFPADLNSQYEITADKVLVSITSSLREPFQVSWVTDNNTKDEMQVSLLEKTGIQGIMSLLPQSDNIPEIKIPVVITLADSRTIGRIDLENKKWRTTPWKNQTPYPLKLKYLHMLLVKDQGGKSTPFIYSWSINDLIVPSSSSVQFDASNVPSWVDDADMAQRIWIEYSVEDCDECDKAIINTITGGTYGSNAKKVTFETFQLFDSLDVQFIQIKVRSKQGDPKGEKTIEFDPVRIYKDNEVTEPFKLYVPLEAELSFEYFITVIMKTGDSFKADNWIDSDEQEVYIGLSAIKNAIPGIPLKNNQ